MAMPVQQGLSTCFTQLQELQAMDSKALVADRAQKYLAMGDGAA